MSDQKQPPGGSGECVRLRPLQCELGVLQRANGSARVVQGETAVLAAVYGPAEVKASRELCDRAALEVVVRPDSGLSSPRQRLLEQLVRSCCHASVQAHLHPHTAISIVLQVENNDGALLSVLVHACCLALLDACLPLSSTFSAATCGFSHEGQLIVDPTAQQEKDCESLLMFVFDADSGNLTTSQTEGAFTIEQLQQAMSAAREASRGVIDFYRQSIRRKLSKDAKFTALNIAV